MWQIILVGGFLLLTACSLGSSVVKKDPAPADPVEAPIRVETRVKFLRCPVPMRPLEPPIDWMPRGCPPKFGACLSGGDAMRMNIYLHAIQLWGKQVEVGCQPTKGGG